MAEQDDLYLENLDEYINDENKIITYKGLSNLLKVSANKSKEMLQNFVEQQSSKGNQLNVTFLLGGKVEDSNKAYKFLIVTKEQLEDAKTGFSCVTCCHIYSVQKAKLKNLEILHGTDIDAVKSSLFELQSWSNIYCPEAKPSDAALRRKQSMEEQNMPNGFHENAPKTTNNIEKKEIPSKQFSSFGKQISSASFFGAANKKTKSSGTAGQNPSANNDTEISAKNSAKEAKSKEKKERKELSFFGKPVQGKNSSHEPEDMKKGRKETDSKIGNVKKDVDAEKDNTRKENSDETSKNSRKDKVKELKVTRGDKPKKRGKKDGDHDSDEVDDTGKEKESKKSKRGEAIKDTEDEPDVKRRKTEMQESESEEDDFESFIKVSKGEEDENKSDQKKMKSKREKSKREKVLEFEGDKQKPKKAKKQPKENETVKKETKKGHKNRKDEKDEEPMELDSEKGSEDAQQTSTEEKPKEKRRIRRKVLKSKTFMNEEGYMVTEKVYESESASEESDSEKTSKITNKVNDAVHKKPREITAENKKFKAEALKSKTQSSLMSFFKKK